jgi:hypothetical protein
MPRVLVANMTVVAVVGPEGSHPLAGIQAENVRVFETDPAAPALDRAVAACERARSSAAPYLVHDADPLAVVAEAWAAWFDGQGARGDLELAVTETLARWRTGALDLPDYYLVIDPEAFGPTVRHWYFGVLGAAAPTRVVASEPATPVVDQLTALRSGRWWPGLDHLLDGIDRTVPDRAGPITAPAPPQIVRP